MIRFRKISLLVALCGLIGLSELAAQDIHFSQFYAAPLELNPALTGVFNCTQRLTANYRNQGAAISNFNAFNTYAVSYDQKIPVGRADYFGVGAIFTGDVAGSLDFGTISGRLSASYSKQLYSSYESKHYLVVGAAGGVSQRSLDWTAAQWGLQHDGMGGFDPAGPSEVGDNLDADFLFADFNVGLLYFSTFDQGRSSFYAGFAANHINRADVSIYIEDNNGNEVFNPLYTRYTIHAGGDIGFDNGMALVPGAVFMSQGPSLQLNLGTALRFDLGGSRYNQQFAQFGVWARVADRVLLEGEDPDGSNPLVSGEETDPWLDAIILYTRFDFNEFGIGFSYDLGVSDLTDATNGNNAFEFSLIYKICRDERRGVYCPRF